MRRPRGLAARARRRVTGLALRRARWVVAIWILLTLALAIEGRDLEQRLTIHPVNVSGKASTRAHDIAERAFGSDYSLVVLLRGPHAELERQGALLARRLDAMPRVYAVSPWSPRRGPAGLALSPRAGAIVVRFEGGGSEGPERLLDPVRERVDATVTAPVRASVGGFPAVIDSLRRAGEEATRIGELVAFPVLILILLLVFRSVFAALLPVLIGGAVVVATRGILSLLLGVFELDLFVAGVVAMMGLALGVDYSLLAVSRFREERAREGPGDAIEQTVAATARSIVPAGSALILAMAAAALMMPGSIGPSVALALTVVALLSMASAIAVVPAILQLAGDRLDVWSLPRRSPGAAPGPRWSRRLVGRPGVVAAIFAGLAIFTALGFGLDSRTVGFDLLPAGDRGRQEQEEVGRALGPGWVAPSEVVIADDGRPVTSPARLTAFARFQHQLERDPGVDTVVGLDGIARGARELAGLGDQLAGEQRGMRRLAGGVGAAHDGAELSQRGLARAASGAGQLSAGLRVADAGSGAVAGGLAATSEGSQKLTQGLGQADEGSGRVAKGTEQASEGAERIADAVARAREQTGELSNTARLLRNAMRSGEDRVEALEPPAREAEESLASARAGLLRMGAGKADPEYAAVLDAVEEAQRRIGGHDPQTGEQVDPGYDGLGPGLEGVAGEFDVGLYLAEQLDEQGRSAGKGMKKLARATRQLERGLERLAGGSARLYDGIAALAGGSEQLSPALARLSDGARSLAGGLGQLQAGSQSLADGLAVGAGKSQRLTDGLAQIGSALDRRLATAGAQSRLSRRSPGLFDSPYLTLAGLDGGRPEQRRQASSLVSLRQGGQVARMLVVGSDPPSGGPASEMVDRLESRAADLAAKTGTEVVVGGTVLAGNELNDVLRERAPLMRIVLSLISLVILIPVMRSLTMPLIAALLNMLVVGATFGVLALLFDGSLLGGPGYVDVSVLFATLMIVFALAIDYEVFVFSRMREEYERTGSAALALERGLGRTAHIVTGAAVIMIAVFLAFSVSSFMSIRNFGVAQAVGVFLDAFLIRLIVIPSLMGWLGERSWWMPRWLDRLVPGGRSPGPPAQG